MQKVALGLAYCLAHACLAALHTLIEPHSDGDMRAAMCRTRVPHNLKVRGQAGALLDPLAHALLLLGRPLKGALVGEDERLVAERQPGHHQDDLRARMPPFRCLPRG